MAPFAGTTQKCEACDRTVYLVDELTADNRVYHKACFRCHHCNGTIKLSNYSSFEGVLYCKPHFDQLFKRTGSLDKSFEGGPKAAKSSKGHEGPIEYQVCLLELKRNVLLARKQYTPLRRWQSMALHIISRVSSAPMEAV